MSKTNKNGGLKKNSNQPQNQLPFDVVKNLQICENLKHKGRFGEHGVKLDFPIVVPYHLTPIVKTKDEMIKYNFNSPLSYGEDELDVIPKQKVLLEFNEDGDISSLTLLITKGGKLYKVLSKKDYGTIKSRYLIDDKGKFINYDKCELVPFNGEYVEFSKVDCFPSFLKKKILLSDINRYDELKKKFNYINGKRSGVCITYFKGRTYGGGYSVRKLESSTYKNGKKNGLYDNTKTLESGFMKNGIRVGEWIIQPPSELNELLYNSKDDIRTLIKVNYVDNEPSGKWEGVMIEDVLSEPRKYRTERVCGYIKDGLSNGTFKSEFWYENKIVEGEFLKGERVGEWKEKEWNKWELKNHSQGRFYSTHTDSYLKLDDVKNYFESLDSYKEIINVYNGNSNEITSETFSEGCLESVGYEFHTKDNSEYTKIKLNNSNRGKVFNEKTKHLIPKKYLNSGLFIDEYFGRIDDKWNQVRVKSDFLIHNGRDVSFLKNNYPYTTEGKDVYDRRKKRLNPILPNDWFSIVREKGEIFELYNRKDNTYTYYVGGEYFELDEHYSPYRSDIDESSETYKLLTQKREEVKTQIVNEIIEMKENEVNEYEVNEYDEENENNENELEFSSFPMD